MDFILDFIVYTVPFLLVITVLVFVHELGHYLIARLNGVRIETFSIGFGKELKGFTDKAGTRWRISLIPLGGYVKMFGDADATSRPSEAVSHVTSTEKAVSFYHKNVWQRISISVAGPVANFIFAIVLLGFLLTLTTHPIPPSVIGEVVKDGAAAEAGFVAGDRIVQVNNKEVSRFAEVSTIVRASEGNPVSLTVKRDGSVQTIMVAPKAETVKAEDGQETTVYRIGIIANSGPYKLSKAIPMAVSETWELSYLSLHSIYEMITGKRNAEELGGPIRIAEMSGNAAKEGGGSLLWLMAFLSISLGILNILPIPALDGGHLLFYAIEAVKGKPLSVKAQEIGFRIGFVVIIALMIFAFWNDISHLRVIDKLR